MDQSFIREMLAIAKEFKLKAIEVDGFKAEFFEPKRKQLRPSVTDLGPAEKIPTDEEFLYMSSGYPVVPEETQSRPPDETI